MTTTSSSTSIRRTRGTRRVVAAATLALVGSALAAAGPASAASSDGTLTAPGGRLPASGCASYPFTWTVHPPQGDWRVDLEVVDPSGRTVASYYSPYAETETTATRTFRVCDAQAAAGTFTLSGDLLVSDGADLSPRALAPVTFTLAAPAQAAPAKSARKTRAGARTTERERAARKHRASQARRAATR